MDIHVKNKSVDGSNSFPKKKLIEFISSSNKEIYLPIDTQWYFLALCNYSVYEEKNQLYVIY